jgi:hypothetical protein
MALTADEVFAQWQPPITSPQGTEETYVVTTLVVTQEDGHTSWGQAEFYVDPVSRVISRGVPRGPTDFVEEWQYFVARFSDNEWTQRGQRQGIHIAATGPGACHLLTILTEWGDHQIDVDLQLVPNPADTGKIYQGWGETIASGSGRALYCLTFNRVERLFTSVGG